VKAQQSLRVNQCLRFLRRFYATAGNCERQERAQYGYLFE
jgi:hypothetical protein